jgi:hypothetical protein
MIFVGFLSHGGTPSYPALGDPLGPQIALFVPSAAPVPRLGPRSLQCPKTRKDARKNATENHGKTYEKHGKTYEQHGKTEEKLRVAKIEPCLSRTGIEFQAVLSAEVERSTSKY